MYTLYPALSDAALVPPETVDHAAEPLSDQWTSDTERGQSQSQPTESESEPTVDVEAEPAVTTAEVAEPVTQQARDDKGQFADKPKGGKKRSDPIARMNDATAKEAAAKEDARLAREETGRLRAELEQHRRPVETPKPSIPASATFPTFETWVEQHAGSDWPDYLAARADHQFEQRWAAEQGKLAQHQRAQTYQGRVQDAKTRYPDWDAVTARPDLKVTAAMEAAIVESDKGPDIVYWLATHPEQCTQLAGESHGADPVVAGQWMRKFLELQVTTGAVPRPDSASVVRPSSAKPPVNRVGGTATATPVDLEDLEFGPEYIRQGNLAEKKRREAGRW